DAEAHLQLHRAEPFRDVAGRLLGEIAPRVAGLTPVQPGCVRLHLGARRPAHQAMRGDAEVPALEVPERDVDAGERLHRQALLAMVAKRGVEALPDRFGRERVGADQQRRHGLDHGGVRPRRAVALAPADGAVRRLDLDQERGARARPPERPGEGLAQLGLEYMRADILDLHGGLLAPDLALALTLARRSA